MKRTGIIVPARLASQRFPEKLLYSVEGHPLILWTAKNLREIAGDIPVHFAVAEDKLAEVLKAAGEKVIMTDPDLPSGTDRIQVANATLGFEWVINVQADEPILRSEHLRELLNLLAQGYDMATLATRFETLEDFRDSNKVKVVKGEEGKALYFSRAPIPCQRDVLDKLPPHAYWHMGLYGYTAEVLNAFHNLSPSYLETTEKLEQLRVLENGGTIGVGISDYRTIGIDTPQDIDELRNALK